MTRAPFRTLTLAVALLVAAMPLAGHDVQARRRKAAPAAKKTPLEQCRDLEANFDFEGMLRECSAPAVDQRLPPEERREFLRLLAIAHASLGDDDTAHVYFLQLLALQPDFSLPDGTSPRLQSCFNKAKDKFVESAKLTVEHVAPVVDKQAAPTLLYRVNDPLGLAAQGQLVYIVTPKGVAPAPGAPSQVLPMVKRPTDTPTLAEFTTTLPSADALAKDAGDVTVHYQLRLLHKDSSEVQNRTPAEVHTVDVLAPEAETSMVPLIGAGVGVAAGVVIIGAIGIGATVWCLNDPACAGEAPVQHENVGAVRVGIAVGDAP